MSKVIIYLRYNENYDKKLPELIEKYRNEGDEIKIHGFKGNKLLTKKEINFLKEKIKKENITELKVVNIRESDFDVLKKELDISVENLDKNKKSISYKIKVMFELLKQLSKQALHTNKDFEIFQSIMAEYDKTASKTTFLNYLNDLKAVFPELIQKVKLQDGDLFRLEDGINFIKEIFQKETNLEKITDLLQDLTDDFIEEFSEDTQKFIKSNKNFIIYKTKPSEELDSYAKKAFIEFKKAILEKKYIDIKSYIIQADIQGYKSEKYENIIPLKMVFMENNWYLAGVTEFNNKDIVRFFRLNFIEEFEIKTNFAPRMIKQKYLDFLKEFQTPFTLYDVKFKKAKIKIIGERIIPYFEIKDHFPNQKPIYSNGKELILEIGYTQPLEVLPIIKKWLPNIEILESENDELQKLLIKDLEKSLSFYKK